MAKPLTREQALQNRAFLKVLARTGNIREAVRETGLKHSTMFHRKKQHPAFAQAWDAAVAAADARLHKRGGCKGPKAIRPSAAPPAAPPPASPVPLPEQARGGLRTEGGEPVVVRRRDGKLQVRRAQPGKLTRECEQAFLAALSATANVALSAAAAGAAEAAFYRRRRNNPAFAREMRMALEMGYERIEMALLENMDPRSYGDDDWRHNDPPPIPPMTVDQALQLLYLHQKEVRLGTPDALRRRPGEPKEAMRMRLVLMSEERDRRAREAFDVAEAERRAQGRPSPFGLKPPVLPDLAQVTGWSKASGAAPYHEGVALFGGWRVADMKGKGKP